MDMTPKQLTSHSGIDTSSMNEWCEESNKRKFMDIEEEASSAIQNAWRRRYQFQTLKYKAKVFKEFYSSSGMFMKLPQERIKKSLNVGNAFKVEKKFTLHLFKAIASFNPEFTMKYTVDSFINGFLIANDKECVVSKWSKAHEELKTVAGDMVKLLEAILLHIQNSGALHQESVRETVCLLCKSIETFEDRYQKTQKNQKLNTVVKFKYDIYVQYALCNEYEKYRKENCSMEIAYCKKTMANLFQKFAAEFPEESAEFSHQLKSSMADKVEDVEHHTHKFLWFSAWDICEPEVQNLMDFNIDILEHQLLLDSNFKPNVHILKGCSTFSACQLQRKFEDYYFHAISQELSGMHVSEVPFVYTHSKLYRIRQWLGQTIPEEFAKEKQQIIQEFLIPAVLRDLILEKCHWSEMVLLLEKYMELIKLVNIPPEDKFFFLEEWKILKNALLKCDSDLEWPSMVTHAIEWIHNCACTIYEMFMNDLVNKVKATSELRGEQFEQNCFQDKITSLKLSHKKLNADIATLLEERFTAPEKKYFMLGKNPDVPRKFNILLLVKYLFEPVPADAKFKDIIPDSLLLDYQSLLELRSTMRFILLANNIMARLVSFERGVDNLVRILILDCLCFILKRFNKCLLNRRNPGMSWSFFWTPMKTTQMPLHSISSLKA